MDKWQLARYTQLPFSAAFTMACLALADWPLPNGTSSISILDAVADSLSSLARA